MKFRRGDRFRDKHLNSVWEYTERDYCDGMWGICVDVGNSNEFKVGERDWWYFGNNLVWEYIGNFSKSNNFNELYNKLNESSY